MKETTLEHKPSIYSLEPDELKEWLVENGEKAFRSDQILQWLYKQRVTSFDEMSNLSKGLREKLQNQFLLSQFCCYYSIHS